MKSENLLTSAELKALLSLEEKEQLEAEEEVPGGEESGGADYDNNHTDPDRMMELKAAISALTFRVDELELQLEQLAAGRQQVAGSTTSLTAVDTISPEPGSFSRSESYGRTRKKKKSILQKLLD